MQHDRQPQRSVSASESPDGLGEHSFSDDVDLPRVLSSDLWQHGHYIQRATLYALATYVRSDAIEEI